MFKRIFSKLLPPEHGTVQEIINFNHPNEINKVLTRCDQELGGFSTVNLDIVPNPDDSKTNVAHFHGYLNLDTPPNRPDITHSGYAMWRIKDQERTFFNKDRYLDWSAYNQVALRVKGDHRKYLINIQADAPKDTDIFQHRLFLNNPNEWETVMVPLNHFVMTNYGIFRDQDCLNTSMIKTIGIGILDKQFGPYSLYVDWIKVMCGDNVHKTFVESRMESSNKKLTKEEQKKILEEEQKKIFEEEQKKFPNSIEG
ncbi:CIA30 family protein [Ascoidea rubescens DSM 1968]|uniref:CIA30-domain-containing protein n=1 Tax=Ascoidea rubescens DSM 1968 TaxID=1344418 RepID=A0A1D2VLM7_9ASCO|nr:CIA30-domain-containing protein [Ascoidea rubescens DSM 1968]ODV62516.1 CIA30-domain-containing protein [Ascoidea rubescens DSM 1968]